MPVQPCVKNGKRGHKWGESGKCYVGPDSRKRAAEQGRAVKAAQARRRGKGR